MPHIRTAALPVITLVILAALRSSPAQAQSEQPGTAYIFPAGGQRGTQFTVTIGGYNLTASTKLHFEGGGLPLVSPTRLTGKAVPPAPAVRGESTNRPFNYPRELQTTLAIDAATATGLHPWRVSTAQGGATSRLFVVGDLPEVLEHSGAPDEAAPQRLSLPTTVNGRIEGEEEIDTYVFTAAAGEAIRCEIMAGRIGSTLDARLEVLDASGRVVMSDEDAADVDPLVQFTAEQAGDYVVRIHDFGFTGSPSHVYRLTLVSFTPGERGLKPVTRSIIVGNYESVTEVRESEPNDAWNQNSTAVAGETVAVPRPTESPLLIQGQLDAGDRDCFRFSARKGERIFVGVWAARLGSNLDTVLRVTNAEGKEVARSDDEEATSDSDLEFAVAADGEYVVSLTDLSGSQARGQQPTYQLLIGPARPDFSVTLISDFADLAPGGSVTITMKVQRSGGFDGPIQLELAGLPQGVKAENLKIAPKGKDHKLVLKVSTDAVIGSLPVRIKATARLGDREYDRLVQFPRAGGNPLASAESVLVTVTRPCPFKVTADDTYYFSSRGTTHPARFKIEREPGFEGDVLLCLADKQVRYLQGITGPLLRVPAGVTDVVYPLFMPETVELNRTCRVLVAGSAEVTSADGEMTHVLAVSPKQCVMRVEPAVLALAASPESLEMNCSITTPIVLTVRRSLTYDGAVRIELVLPPGARGISADPVNVVAGQSTVEVPLRIAKDADLGGHEAIRFRATGVQGDLPVVAEAHIEITLRKSE